MTSTEPAASNAEPGWLRQVKVPDSTRETEPKGRRSSNGRSPGPQVQTMSETRQPSPAAIARSLALPTVPTRRLAAKASASGSADRVEDTPCGDRRGAVLADAIAMGLSGF